MALQPLEGMDEYLKPTELCDSDNHEVRKRAREFIKDTKTPKEIAIRIFYFVRDQIVFALDNYDVKASETLKKGIGHCIAKTIFQLFCCVQ